MAQTDNTSAAFEAAYRGLNKEQKEAVDTIEGPVMVIAGPGTGKTQILTLRIANILLQTDTAPSSVLALTFTESGAKAMRERLRRYIGADAYQVPIFTFHGFANRLISEYPDAFPDIIGGRAASDLEKITLVERILDGGSYKVLRPAGNPAYYVRAIIGMISTLKQEYITPEAFLAIVDAQEAELDEIPQFHEKGAHKGKERGEYTKKAKAVAKNRELLQLYRMYQQLLREAKLFDFDDMIAGAVTAMQGNEDLLRDLQEQYQYVLADEHQDVNGSQNKILELLCSFHESPNIFVVGDEKQAIYRFQGASLENFLYFEDIFKNTKTIALDKNYRSGQAILDAAHDLVRVEEGPLSELRIPLSAEAVESANVTFKNYSHQAVEDEALVAGVQAAIASGVAPEEVAVIVRTNREVESLAALLRAAGVPVTQSADGDILRHPLTQVVQSLIAAVAAPSNQQALFEVLHGSYWGIGASDLVRICAARTYNVSLQQIITDEAALIDIGVTDVEAVLKVSKTLETARTMETSEAPHQVLQFLLKESGFLDQVVTYDPFEGVRVVRRIYDEVEEMVRRDGVATLMGVAEVFRTAREYALPLNAPYISTNTASVQVMTAHKSKGLEFAVVFSPHLLDSAWGGKKKAKLFDIPLAKHIDESQEDRLDDERRLLYVVMTRAKEQLYISSSETNADGKELQTSQLLFSINEELYDTVLTDEAEAAFSPATSLETLAEPVAVDAAVLTDLLSERGFSATSLNNYLRDPWDYFYRNVLRIPEVQATPLLFGTAVHDTLEYMTRAHTKDGVLPDATAIKARLETELARAPVTTEEYTRLLERGLEVLVVYRDHLEATLPAATKEELKIRVLLETGLPEVPELPLTGMLDRLDLNDEGFALRVLDYKTGKPKTRNAIEGNTKTSDGGYKRQLVFYALLLELYNDERYVTRTGTLSFVEADGKGVIKEETFIITDEEVAALKAEIIEAARQIISGDFLSQPCAEDSDYAVLVSLLRDGEKG